MAKNTKTCSKGANETPSRQIRLKQWPCKISFVPEYAPYFDGAELLIAADCTAYAYGGLHSEFMKNSITLIGCPALDSLDMQKKLSAIISSNDIRAVKILKMDVACCSRLEAIIKDAIKSSEKNIPLEIITVSTDGKILV